MSASRRIAVILSVFLYIGANAAFGADAAAVSYVNAEKVGDYVETLSKAYKSGKDRNADILRIMESMDGFIQGNIILWETFTTDERKKRIKHFEKMLEDFTKSEAESFYIQEINIQKEFSDRVSLIIKDVMRINKSHVLVEINKKEEIPADAVDITGDVVEELARYAKSKSAEDIQKIADTYPTLYRIGRINAQGVGLREGDNDSKVIGLLSNEDVIVISFDKVYRLKVLSSRGIGYVKMQYIDIKESYGAAKE